MLVVNSVTDNSSGGSKSTTQGEESFQTWAKFSMQETSKKSRCCWLETMWCGMVGIKEEKRELLPADIADWKWHQTSFTSHSKCSKGLFNGLYGDHWLGMNRHRVCIEKKITFISLGSIVPIVLYYHRTRSFRYLRFWTLCVACSIFENILRYSNMRQLD